MKRMILLLCLSALLGACSSWLPDDAYAKTDRVPVLEVPEGMQRPAADPSLAVPEGKAEWKEQGHEPPAVAGADVSEEKAD